MDELERLATTHDTVHTLTDFANAHRAALIEGGFDAYTAEQLTYMYYQVLLRNYERKLAQADEDRATAQRNAAVERLADLLKKEQS